MKSVVMLWVACLKEAGDQHHVRIDRDLAYAESRIEQEGDQFLTITLPNFEKDLLTAITQGSIGSNLFVGFRRRGGLPAFLSGFLCHLFNGDGELRVDADITVLRTVRQILLLVSKVKCSVAQKRERQALKAYVDTDASLEEIPESLLADFRDASKALLAPYLAAVESRIWSGDWIPRHSSGALATRESYNSRYSSRTWTERLQAVLPWEHDLAVSPRELIDNLDEFSVLASEQEPPSKVTTVPKTMKGPRIIAEEPVWNQFVQQGVLSVMTETLSESRFRPLADIFSWLDQEPNRELARVGSIDGSFATLDLSEASDRVSLQLVEALLAQHPFLRDVVLASRSQRAKLSSGQTIVLKKFASMGSSLCFPMESMVFFIIEAIAWAEHEGIVPSQLRIRGLPRMRVYGDDLIVPSTVAQNLSQRLESYGLRVNTRKSFTTGPIRESCGADWYHGEDISVFKVRDLLPETDHQSELIASAIDLHNRAYSAGWTGVAAAVEESLSKLFRRLPRAPVGTRIPALWTWDNIMPNAVRHEPRLQRLQYRSFILRQVKPVDPLEGYGAFKKFALPHSVDRTADHLERDGRSRYAGVHIGWLVAPY